VLHRQHLRPFARSENSKMKILVLLSLAALAIASDFKMKLNENGEEFTEEIKVDIAGNTEEIKVPQHQNRMQADILSDFNIGFRALKIVKAKLCYISAIDASEQRPAQMEESMQLAHSKFPEDRFMIINDRYLKVRKMSADEVGKKIAAHCKGSEMFLAVKVTKENIEKTALGILKAMRSRPKRDTPVEEFTSCNFNSQTLTVMSTCPRNRLGAQCKFYRTDQRTCAYKVQCRPVTDSTGRKVSSCTGQHKYSLLACCDFKCF